jgi:hypothetical protein
VIADIKHIKVNQIEKNRVKVSNVAGFAPPSTTKLAVFHRGGFTFEFYAGATGLDVDHKVKILQTQLARGLEKFNAQDKVFLDVQVYGKAQVNADSQLASTSIIRVYFQAETMDKLFLGMKAIGEMGLQHFAGYQQSLHRGSFTPQPIVTYFLGLVKQSFIQEKVYFIRSNLQIDIESVLNTTKSIPKNTNEPTTTNGTDTSKFGPTTEAP